MSNRLPIPKELESLIEKRDEKDRRKTDRRKSSGKPSPTAQERRTGKDRRKKSRRSTKK